MSIIFCWQHFEAPVMTMIMMMFVAWVEGTGIHGVGLHFLWRFEGRLLLGFGASWRRAMEMLVVLG